jgi:ADP-ribosylglycohydrolase
VSGPPKDHPERMERVRLALEGLSVGDALGERFFDPDCVAFLLPRRKVPPGPWPYTDDTEMALGIVEVLDRCGGIDSDELAQVFAERYRRDPFRGYGGMAHRILTEIGRGESWKVVSRRAFGGEGSMGNGAAMRVAPVGAYFADDLEAVAAQAEASAVVTHAHPEGRAGAIAVALAAAGASRIRERGEALDLLELALRGTPAGRTREGIERARAISIDAPVTEVVRVLGNGSHVIASDTVPFALWCASRHLRSYPDAFWATVSGLGDRDTTCAIVGGIVALASGRESIPRDWIFSREPLD